MITKTSRRPRTIDKDDLQSFEPTRAGQVRRVLEEEILMVVGGCSYQNRLAFVARVASYLDR